MMTEARYAIFLLASVLVCTYALNYDFFYHITYASQTDWKSELSKASISSSNFSPGYSPGTGAIEQSISIMQSSPNTKSEFFTESQGTVHSLVSDILRDTIESSFGADNFNTASKEGQSIRDEANEFSNERSGNKLYFSESDQFDDREEEKTKTDN